MKRLFLRNGVALSTVLLGMLWIALVCVLTVFHLMYAGHSTWILAVTQLFLGATLAVLAFTVANRPTIEACLTAVPWFAAMVAAFCISILTTVVDMGVAYVIQMVLFAVKPFATMAIVKLVCRFVSEETRQPWTILTALGAQWGFSVLEAFTTWSTIPFQSLMAFASGVGGFSISEILGFTVAYVLCVKCSKVSVE